MDYGNLLVQRSTDFAPFGTILYPAYPDQSLHPLVLDLIQQLWDRGDPDGYAQQMTAHPLPDTPSHQVLMQIAYGDHQVSMYAAAVEARTVGASVYQPALDLSTNRSRDREPVLRAARDQELPVPRLGDRDLGQRPGHTQPPPFANSPRSTPPTNIDPHEDPRNTPAAQQQSLDFLEPSGTVINVCGGTPCRSSDYTP